MWKLFNSSKKDRQKFDDIATAYMVSLHYEVKYDDDHKKLYSPEYDRFIKDVRYSRASFDWGSDVEEYIYGEQRLSLYYDGIAKLMHFEHRDRFGKLHESESF